MRTIFLIFAALASVAAQSFEVGAGGGVHRLTSNDLGSAGRTDRYVLNDGWRFGFRMAFNSWRFMGNETGYGYNRTSIKAGNQSLGGMAIHQGFYNFLLYGLPDGSPVRPFATGGVHFSNFVPPGSSASYGQGSTKFGVNYGGGIKVKLNHMLGIRFDVRQYLQGKPFDLPGQSGKLRLTEVSAGFYVWM
jgi:hypothetical protein